MIFKHILFNLIFISLPLIAGAKTYRSLSFEGVSKDIISKARQASPKAFTKSAGLSNYDDLVRILMSTKKFEGVELHLVRRRTVGSNTYEQLQIRAFPVRIVNKIDVTGNREFSSGSIIDILELELGQRFERKKLALTAEKLKDAYAEKGYLNASIELSFEVKRGGAINIQVTIKEGPVCEIAQVIFEMDNENLVKTLSGKVKKYLGRALTDTNIVDMQNNLNQYFAEKRYLNSRVRDPVVTFNQSQTQARIRYKVKSFYRYEFVIEGVVSDTPSSIIRSFDLSDFRRTVYNPAAELADKIRNRYKNKGFAHVQVDYRIKTDNELYKKIIYFKVNEGPRVKIRKIKVSGNISREPDYYADIIKETSGEPVSDGYYKRDTLENGRANLETALQNQGHLKARVQSMRTEFSKDKARATIYVNLNEGPITKVNKIIFRGATAFKRSIILKILKVQENAPLRLDQLEKSIESLKDFYHNNGFLEMRIRNEGEKLVLYKRNNTLADIDFDIYEGPKVIVSSIAIDGNDFTKDYVILREIEFAIGDVLTPQKIEDSIDRLQRLGLFTRADIRTVEEGTSISQRTVVVKVNEADPGVFNTGVGATSENRLTYRGFIGFAYRNISGTARGFNARAELKYASPKEISFLENKVTLGYLEPFLFGSRTRGRVNLTRAEDVQDPNPPVPIKETQEVQFLLERDLNRHLKITWKAWGFERIRDFERRGKTLSRRDVATIGPLVQLDYRDDPFNPSSGTLTRWNLDYSNPKLGSNDTIHYMRTTGSFTHYIALKSKRWVWANSIRGGYLTNLRHDDPNAGVPWDKAFYLGSRTTIRGFGGSALKRIPSISDLLPEGANFDTLSEFFKVKNDSHFALIKTEIRFPIYGDFGGAIFYDGGMVIVNGSEIPTFRDPYRDSVGIGFRYRTPVGPVSLEYGHKLDRKEFEDPGRLHFSIGTF